MDRHPQQLKRERQDQKRRARNVADMSTLRTHIKQVLQSSDKEEAEKLFKLLNILEENEDINLVSSNFEVSDEILSSLTI